MVIINKVMVFSLITFSIFFYSCNNVKLEKDEAKLLIEKELNLPAQNTMTLQFDPMSADNGMRNLQNGNMITINYNDDALLRQSEIHVQPTEKGKPYFVDKVGDNEYKFNICVETVGQILGIAIDEKDKTATVRYTTKNINITPVARILEKSTYLFGTKKYIKNSLDEETEKEVVFKKFDTGWKK